MSHKIFAILDVSLTVSLIIVRYIVDLTIFDFWIKDRYLLSQIPIRNINFWDKINEYMLYNSLFVCVLNIKGLLLNNLCFKHYVF